MRARILVSLVVGVALAACGKPDHKAAAQAVRPNWLLDVPYIAKSVLLDTTGTPDAQHVVLLSPGPIDSVAAFYRTGLPRMGWRIVSDVADTIHVSLYLERGGVPMWILLDAQGPETRVAFTAAGVPAKPAPVAPAPAAAPAAPPARR